MIKLFEEYNEYYSLLTRVEAHNMTCGNLEHFSKNDIKRIEDLLFKLNPGSRLVVKEYNEEGDDLMVGDVYVLTIQCFEKFDYDFMKFKITVCKIPDEWYLVYCWIPNFISYYKCDQLDGFEKLITDRL